MTYPVGQRLSEFTDFDVPTTMDGSVIRAPIRVNEAYKGTFPAGWSFPSGTITAVSDEDVGAVRYTADTWPAGVSWHLYDIVTRIGAQLDPVNDTGLGVKSSGVTPGKPAALAGVEMGDVLVEVDGQNISALPQGRVLALVRSLANTSVTLGIKRGSETTIRGITVVRIEYQAVWGHSPGLTGQNRPFKKLQMAR